ncbi:MAG: FAD:protein FMN transferase [Gammaproteobacteria bacterium]
MTKLAQRFAWIVMITGVTLIMGCTEAPQEARARFLAMGTLVEVTIFDHPQASAEAAIAEIESLFGDLEQRWDPWEGGDLAQLNKSLGTGSKVRPPDDLLDLLLRASRIGESSGGLFEPSIGSLTRLWGFSNEESAPTSPPAKTELSKQLRAVRPLPELWTEDGYLQGYQGLAIDLGGFAKGEAVDIAIDLLRNKGIEHAIVNAGGDLRAIGRHGDRDWRIGVREPRGEGVLAAIHVSGDESVFTSGDYERFFVKDGRRFHHIIDPRDGYPADRVMSVTVIAGSAALADAAATALFVAGPDDWAKVAASLGLDKVMMVDASGNIHMSPEMESRVWLQGEPAPTVIVEEVS